MSCVHVAYIPFVSECGICINYLNMHIAASLVSRKHKQAKADYIKNLTTLAGRLFAYYSQFTNG